MLFDESPCFAEQVHTVPELAFPYGSSDRFVDYILVDTPIVLKSVLKEGVTFNVSWYFDPLSAV